MKYQYANQLQTPVTHCDEFDLAEDKLIRRRNAMIGCIPSPICKGKGGENLWLTEEVDKSLIHIWSGHMQVILPVEKELLNAQVETIEEATKRYLDVVKQFRSAAKNDVAAAKSSAVAVEESVVRMKRAYDSAVERLTAPDFTEAVQNAERLAAALQAIEKLTATKVSFAVFGSGGQQ